MINISGYAYDMDVDHIDIESDFYVTSCGHYILKKLPQMVTYRPYGRRDYQILYVARGLANFELDGETAAVGQGGLVLYRPGQPQNFTYSLENKPEVYWMHFLGSDAENIIQKLGFDERQKYNAGINNEFTALFEKIINELQIKPHMFSTYTAYLGKQLLLLLMRGISNDGRTPYGTNAEIGKIIERFHRDYKKEHSLDSCAAECNLGLCWFIRSFKRITGMPPNAYLMQIRLNKAADLLLNSTCSINEISCMVGYDNPLYFSRIFKKRLGVSPREYRLQIKKNHGENIP